MQALLNVGELAHFEDFISLTSFPQATGERCAFRFWCFERSKCLQITIECPVMHEKCGLICFLIMRR
jgi:hypothetical protein